MQISNQLKKFLYGKFCKLYLYLSVIKLIIMPNILRKDLKFLIQAIAIGTMFGIYSLPLNSQTNTSEYDFLNNIETEENLEWSFSSEDESISIKDDIKELGDYSISESELEEVIELSDEDPKWGNRGDVEDLSIEAEVYDY